MKQISSNIAIYGWTLIILLNSEFTETTALVEWDIPCIARVMVRITLSGGVSNVSQRAGWNDF